MIRQHGELEVFQDIDGAKDDLHRAADEYGCEDRGKGAEGGHFRRYGVYFIQNGSLKFPASFLVWLDAVTCVGV